MGVPSRPARQRRPLSNWYGLQIILGKVRPSHATKPKTRPQVSIIARGPDGATVPLSVPVAPSPDAASFSPPSTATGHRRDIMTQPENFTAAQASDPQTPGQVLADIAALRPDLRVAVASNPSTYPGLLEWLRGLGEPALDAAIAARRAAFQQTQQMPTLPPMAPPAPSWAGQPAAQAPPPMVTPGYPGMPPQGGGPGLQYAGMPPQGGGPGLQYAGTAPKKSNSALWIILGVVGLIILLTIGAVIFFINKARNVVEDNFNLDEITNDLNNLTGGNHGDNATFDALWDACAAEDWASCDQLYLDSPFGSEYESFGDPGGTRPVGARLWAKGLGGEEAPGDPNAFGGVPPSTRCTPRARH